MGKQLTFFWASVSGPCMGSAQPTRLVVLQGVHITIICYKSMLTPFGTFPVPPHVGQTSDPALKSNALPLRGIGLSLILT